MKNRIISLAVVFGLLFAISINNVIAEDKSRSSSANAPAVRLQLSGGSATAAFYITITSTESISATLYIQQKVNGAWRTIKSASSTKIPFSCTCSIVSGYEYRAKAVYCITTNNGQTESNSSETIAYWY